MSPPIFEYKCRLCNSAIEIIHKSTEVPQNVCGNCGNSNVMEKQLPVTNPPKFKGSGFHATDYKTREGKK